MSSVFDFGAVGDGIADDTDALQHAVDEGGGEVILPKGDFRITRTIKVNLEMVGRISIRGTGGLAKVIMAGPGPAFLVTGSHGANAYPLNFKPQVWKNERFPTLDGLEIEGAHREADGVRFIGTMQATMTRVVIRQVRTAVHLLERNRNVLIDACHFYHNTGIGIHFDNVNLHQTIITSSHISYCRLGGIRIEGGEIRNLHITGNDIEYNNSQAFLKEFPEDAEHPHPTAEIYFDVRKGSIREGSICSNTIQATVSKGGCNIRLIGSDKTEGQFGMFTITGNLIGNQETNIHATTAWGLVISGNQIYGCTHRNLLIENSRNVVIDGNMIGHTPDFNKSKLQGGIRIENSTGCSLSGVQIQDPQDGPAPDLVLIPTGREALLELVNCERTTVTGCQILDPVGTGVLVDSCRQLSLQGSQISDARTRQRMEHGILLRGNQKQVIVSNCQIYGANQSPIEGIPNDNITLINNVTG